MINNSLSAKRWPTSQVLLSCVLCSAMINNIAVAKEGSQTARMRQGKDEKRRTEMGNVQFPGSLLWKWQPVHSNHPLKGYCRFDWAWGGQFCRSKQTSWAVSGNNVLCSRYAISRKIVPEYSCDSALCIKKLCCSECCSASFAVPLNTYQTIWQGAEILQECL